MTSSVIPNGRRVRGIAHTRGMAILRLSGMGKSNELMKSLFEKLEGAAVEVRLFNQCLFAPLEGTLILAVPESDAGTASELCKSVMTETGVTVDLISHVGLVSLVGGSLFWTGGISSEVFGRLASLGVRPYAVSTSAITLTCLIPEERVEQAVRELHRVFIEEKQACGA